MAMTKAAAALLAHKRLGKLVPDLKRYDQIKLEIAKLIAEQIEIEERCVVPLSKLKDKGYTVDDGTHFTAVEGHTTTYDEKSIRAAIGEDLWDKVKSEKLDRAKLATAIMQGLVSDEMVASHATITPKKPYILVTRPGATTNTGKDDVQAA